MAFIDTIPTAASNSQDANKSLLASSGVSSSNTAINISNEEEEEKKLKTVQLKSWMDKRSILRKAISSGQTTSGDKKLDEAEVRKSRLGDLAREALINAGKDSEKIQSISDDELIQRLVGSNNGTNTKKLNAVNNYIQNGGYANDVFNYITGQTDSVYSKQEEEKDYGYVENALRSTGATIVKSLGGLSDIVQKNVKYGGESIYDINKAADLSNLGDLVGGISTDEYNKYKSGELGRRYQASGELQNLGSLGKDLGLNQYTNKEGFYKSYDDAVNSGFQGTVEQYGQYLYNKAQNVYKSTAEQVEEAANDFYDEGSAGAGLGKFAGQMIEFLATPELKITKLANAPKFVKMVSGALEKTPNIVKGTTKLLAEGAEFQALEDMYNSQLSSLGEYTTTSLWNAAIGGVLRGAKNLLAKPSGAALTAIKSKTTQAWDRMTNITKTSLKDPNSKITPYTEISDLLNNAYSKLMEKKTAAGKKLGETRKSLKYKNKKYSVRNILSDFNEAFSNLQNKETYKGITRGENAQIPSFSVKRGSKNLDITNKSTLNSITRNEGGQVIKLGDEIQNIWDRLFIVEDKEINAATTDQFIREVKGVLKDSGWKGSEDNAVKIMREVFEDIDAKFGASLENEEGRLADREASKKMMDIKNAFDNLIGRLDGKYSSVDAASKSTNMTEAQKLLFSTIKDEVGIDLNNEIGAWIANVSLYNPDVAKRLVETIYPSQPGAYEFLIKSIMTRAKRSGARASTQGAGSSAWSKMIESIGGNVASKF